MRTPGRLVHPTAVLLASRLVRMRGTDSFSGVCAKKGRYARGTALAVTGLAVVAALVYAPAVFGPPFYTKGEPREAIVVQRMLRDRDFVLPHRTATEIPAKPPLFHWLGAAASAVQGRVSEASARLPSLAASLLVLVITLCAGVPMVGSRAAWFGTLLLGTSLQWIASSVTARVDMVLAAAVAAAMFSFQHAHVRGARWPDRFWFACALAVLTKGPVGLVLPVACASAFLVLRRDLGYTTTIRPSPAVLFLLIPLTWYVLAWHRAGDVFLDKIVSENIYRMVDADAGDELGHRHTALFYLPALLSGLAPWSLMLAAALLERTRAHKWKDEPRSFLLVWLVTTVLFFSVADSKRTVYLLPCYPAAALLMGDWLERWIVREETPLAPESKSAVWVVRAMLLLAAVTATAVALESVRVPVLDVLRPFVSPGDAANLLALAQASTRHRTALLAWVVCFLGVLAACEYSLSRRSWRAVCVTLVLGTAGSTAVLSATIFRDLARSQSVKPFIVETIAQLPHGYPLYYYAGTSGQPDVPFFKTFEYAAGFYAERPLTILRKLDLPPNATMWFITAEETFAELIAPTSSSDSHLNLRALGRFDYGDNSRRTPIVFAQATRP